MTFSMLPIRTKRLLFRTAAAFGGYLRSLGGIELPARLTLLQGQHMGAPSRLEVDISRTAVRVTGTAHRLGSTRTNSHQGPSGSPSAESIVDADLESEARSCQTELE